MPVMLPIMVLSFCYYSFSYLGFLRSFQRTVDEIWLDRSGTEVRLVYRNKKYRKFRGNNTEEKILCSGLVTPMTIGSNTSNFNIYL